MIGWLALACTGGDLPGESTADTGALDLGTPFGAVRASPVPDYGSVIRVAWRQEAAATVHVEYSFEDDRFLSSPARALEPGPHDELLLGVPYGQQVAYRLVTDTGVRSLERTVATDRLPPIVPTAEIVSFEPSRVDPDVPYLLVGVSEDGSLRRTWITLIDRQGRVIWAHRTPSQRNSMQPRVSRGGTSFLIDHSSYFADVSSQGRYSEVVELKIDGSVVQVWDTPGQHHPFVDLPDGSLAYARYDFGVFRDDRIEIIRPSGAVETLFSCREFVAGHALPLADCGSNTTHYDPTRDTFLFSMFTFDSVFEIGASNGEVRRLVGTLGLSPFPAFTGLPEWTFEPAESRFHYQHNPVWTDEGTLLLSTHRGAEDTELVVREYEVDEVARVFRQVWSFGEGEGLPGCQMGEAHRLDGGNTLHNHGTFAVLREVTREGEVVWDARWEDREYSCYGGPSTPGHQILRSTPVGSDLYRFAPERR